jgi:hypothetical protein
MKRASTAAIWLIAFVVSGQAQTSMPGTPSPNTPGPTNPIVQAPPGPISQPKSIKSGSRGVTGNDEDRSPDSVPPLPGPTQTK